MQTSNRCGLALAAALVAGISAASADAAVFTFVTTLSGPAEAPPNNSPGTGTAQVDIDDVARTMRIRATFSGLLGNVTVAHIHAATPTPFAGTAGVATQTPSFSGFPAGVTSGSYDNTFDLTLSSSFNAAYITANGGTTLGAQNALIAALNDGKAYFNLHSSTFPGGELRGFFVVPAPGALAMLGVAGLAAARRRRN